MGSFLPCGWRRDRKHRKESHRKNLRWKRLYQRQNRLEQLELRSAPGSMLPIAPWELAGLVPGPHQDGDALGSRLFDPHERSQPTILRDQVRPFAAESSLLTSGQDQAPEPLTSSVRSPQPAGDTVPLSTVEDAWPNRPVESEISPDALAALWHSFSTESPSGRRSEPAGSLSGAALADRDTVGGDFAAPAIKDEDDSGMSARGPFALEEPSRQAPPPLPLRPSGETAATSPPDGEHQNAAEPPAGADSSSATVRSDAADSPSSNPDGGQTSTRDDAGNGGRTSGNENRPDADRLAAPELQRVHWASGPGSGQLLIAGSIRANLPAGSQITIEFFEIMEKPRSRHAEPKRLLGSTTVVQDASRVTSFKALVDAEVTPDGRIVAQARLVRGAASPLSEPMAIHDGADADRDGIADDVESLGPSGGDANRDGVLDRHQANVASLPSARGRQFVTLVSGGHALKNAKMSRQSARHVKGVDLPYGLFDFEIVGIAPGGATTVEMLLPEDARPDAYLKQDPESGRMSRFDFDGQTGAVIRDNRITLYLVDGGRGDADGLVNGVIVDPGGPGSFSITSLVSNGLEGWTIVESGGSPASKGSVTFESGPVFDSFVLREGDSFYVSLERNVDIPRDPGLFRFTYEAAFDTSDRDFINDDFEVALVDEHGQPVALPIEAGRDSYFNQTEEEPVATGPSASTGQECVDLDIANLTPGDRYRLMLRLVNNDDDTGSQVRLMFNFRPTARDDRYTIGEDQLTTLDVLANDTAEPDLEDALTIVDYDATGIPGTLILVEAARFEYTPPPNYSGPASFTYTITDGTTGHTDVATVRITVEPINDRPEAADDAGAMYRISEDSSLSIAAPGLLANDSDVEGDPLTARRVTPASHGTANVNPDGSFVYAPDPNYVGEDSFTYQVNDGKADSNVATVTVVVDPENDVLAHPDSYSVDEDGSITVPAGAGVLVNDYDAEGDPLTATEFTAPAHGTLLPNVDGSFVYTVTEANYHGLDSFTYLAYDGIGYSGPATVTIDIMPINDAPVAAADSYPSPQYQDVDEDNPLVVSAPGVLINDTDVEGDEIHAFLVAYQGTGTIHLNEDGCFTYLPGDDFFGTDSFTYRVNDGAADGNITTVTIHVSPVPDAPMAANDSYSAAEDTPLSITAPGVLVNDTDADPGQVALLTAEIIAGPPVEHGVLTPSADGSFSFAPALNFYGTTSFTYQARDPDGNLSNTATVQIIVDPVNDPPVDVDDAYQVDEDGTLTVSAALGLLANDTDVDSPTITAAEVHYSGNGVLSWFADGSFTYQPDNNFHGTDSFTYQPFDGIALGSVRTVTITVAPINDPPVALADGYLYIVDAAGLLSITAPGVLVNDVDIDGDPLTAHLDQNTPSNAVTLNPDGSFVYDPPAGFAGVESFSYHAADGTVSSDSVMVTITVDHSPLGVDDAYQVDEDGMLTVSAALGVLANDDDVDPGDTLQALGWNAPEHGTLVPNSDGSFTYTPDGNWFGTDSFTYHPFDGMTVGNVTTVTITVDSVPDRPEAASDNYYYLVDPSGQFVVAAPGVLANDRDVDLGDTLQAVDWSTPAQGTLDPNTDGSFVYEPPPGFSGVADFTYKAFDGSFESHPATVTITVNHAPDAVDDAYTTLEDTPLVVSVPGVLANDVDPGEVPQIVEWGQPVHGTLTPNSDGSFSYSPQPNWFGTDSFTYRIKDGFNESDTATVTITVASVPDLPTAVNDSYSIAEDSILVVPARGVLVNDTDADPGQTALLTAEIVAGPTHGTLDPPLGVDGSFTYRPSPNYYGPDSFTYRALDPDGNLSNVATVSITVTSVNDPPIGFADTYTTYEDVPLVVTAPGVLANDDPTDGPTLRAQKRSSPNSSHGAVTAFSYTGAFTFVPASNWNGTTSFLYRPYDNAGGYGANTTITIIVLPMPDAPVANNDSYSIAEDATLTVPARGVLVNDTDADSGQTALLTVEAGTVTDPEHGTLAPNSDGSFTYTPDGDWFGTDSFTYRARDPDGNLSNTATVYINVISDNHSPVAAGDSYTVDEDHVLYISGPGVLANDNDDDPEDTLGAVQWSTPAHGTLVPNSDGSFTYTPGDDWFGIDSFTYYAADDETTSVEPATVTITVNPVNDPPEVTGESYVFLAGVMSSLAMVAPGVLENDDDIDSPTITVAEVDYSGIGVLTWAADGSFTYTPPAGFVGVESFTYRATDGEALSGEANVMIHVTHAPTAVPDTYATDEDVPLVVSTLGVLANDYDPDPGETTLLTAQRVSPPSHGTLATDLATDGSFVYVPDANWFGTDSFTYQATDGVATGDVVTVTIHVLPLPDAPVAASDGYSVAEDLLLSIAAPGVLANDSDADPGDVLQAELVAGPPIGHGVLTLCADGPFTFAPALNFYGTTSFTYLARDPSGNISTTATVQITVDPVNDPPVGVDDAYQVDEDGTLTVSAALGLLANDTDVDSPTITVAEVHYSGDGVLVWFTDGSFTYQPDNNFHGTDSFTYQPFDGIALGDVRTVAIDVAPFNDPPVAAGNSYTLVEDIPLTVAAPGVLADDTDVDSPTITVAEVHYSGGGVLTWTADGSFTYEPADDLFGADSFTYTAFDGQQYSSPATVQLVIEPVNDAPRPGEDSYSVNEDGVLTVAAAEGVLLGDVDVEGEMLAAHLAQGPADGSLVLNEDGSFTYRPNTNFCGVDFFTYQASDGELLSAPTLVTIVVVGVDDPSFANDDYYSIGEDRTLAVGPSGVLDNDTNLDQDQLQAILLSGPDPAHGTLILDTDGSFTFTPQSDWHGVTCFTYQNSDELTLSNVATVRITVEAINDTPIAVADSFALSVDNMLTVAAPGLLANDTDSEGDTLMAIVVNSPTEGAITAWGGDGSFSYKPRDGFVGLDSFTYQANDSQADSNVITVTIVVSAVKFYVVDSSAGTSFRYQDNGNPVDGAGLAAGNSNPRGATSNAAGDRLWVIEGGASGNVFVYNRDGSLRGSWQAQGLAQPEGLATDGDDLWIVDAAPQQRRVLFYSGGATRTSGTQAETSSFALVAENASPTGITTDGTTIWISDDGADKVFVYDSTGVLLGSWQLDGANGNAAGITNDPTGSSDDLWTVDRTTRNVYRYASAVDRRSSTAPVAASGTFLLGPGNLAPEDIADPTVWISSWPNAQEGVGSSYFRLSRDSSEGSLAVSYYFDEYSSTAENGTDFAYLPGTGEYDPFGEVTFGDGQTTVDIPVAPTGGFDDTLVEGNETVRIALQSGCSCGCGPAAYLLGSPSSATLTITDNDQAPTVHIDSWQNAAEGGTAGYFRLRRDVAATALTVYYLYDDYVSTALNGADFAYLSGVVTFAAGQETVDIPVIAVNETLREGDETVRISLYSGCGSSCGPAQYVLGSPSSATLTIIDDDQPVVRIDSFANAQEGVTAGYFRLRRNVTAGSLAVNYSFDAVSTATNGRDFPYLPGTGPGDNNGEVVFLDGQSTIDIPVDPREGYDDGKVEPDETVQITLQPATDSACSCCGVLPSYSIGSPSTATLTIADEDVLLDVQLSDASVVEGDSGTRLLSFRVALSQALSHAVDVDFVTIDGTAVAPYDYTAASGSITFPQGATERWIDVIVHGDCTPAARELLVVELTSNDIEFGTGSRTFAVGTIVNDDNEQFDRTGSFVFTTTEDFHEGRLANVTATAVPDEVRWVAPGPGLLPFINVPASSRGTIIRIDVGTGQIIGEYNTAPGWGYGSDPLVMGHNPSRTSVDLLGNVWVGNRDEFQSVNGVPMGSVTRIGVVIGGERGNKVDSSGNPWVSGEWFFQADDDGEYLQGPFDYSTAVDRDGDGLIRTSRGLGNILSWSNADGNQDGMGDDTLGGVSTAEDELILNYTRTKPAAVRLVAVDANNDVWVGSQHGVWVDPVTVYYNWHEKLSGETGQRIDGTQFDYDAGGYGGFVDGNGVLWSARYGQGLLRFTPSTINPPGVGQVLGNNTGDYGIALDPNTGHVWHAGNSVLYELDPLGNVLNSYTKPSSLANQFLKGLAVDGNSHVWVAGYPNQGYNASSIWHLAPDPASTPSNPLPHVTAGVIGGFQGIHSVGVDANGKIWAPDGTTNVATCIDPNPDEGPEDQYGYKIPVIVATVSLGEGANPYTYSDMTGFVSWNALSDGTWTHTVDGELADTPWLNVIADTTTPGSSSIELRARAANSLDQLDLAPYRKVASGETLQNVAGRYFQVQVVFESNSAEDVPSLQQLVINSVSVPPQIQIDSPAHESQFFAGTTVVIAGHAVTGQPEFPLATVMIDGRPVDALDAGGAFFTQVTLLPGRNTFQFAAVDVRGHTATTSHTLVGTSADSSAPAWGDLPSLAHFTTEYHRTSFHPGQNVLYADAALTNTGPYAVTGPVLLGITNISHPGVHVFQPDGVSREGIPYFDITDLVADGVFSPAETTALATLSFNNPHRVPFTYDLVLVGAANHAPQFNSVPPVSVADDREYRYQALAIDPDGDQPSYRLVAAPPGMAIDSTPGSPTRGLVVWPAAQSSLGSHSVSVEASDGRGGTATQSFTLVVHAPVPNRPPVFDSLPVVNAHVAAAYAYDADASDPDGDVPGYALEQYPAGMTIDAATGLIAWTPAADQVGDHTVVVTATDGYPAGDPVLTRQSFTVRVSAEPENHPPVIVSPAVTEVLAGATYRYQVAAADPDPGDQVSFEIVPPAPGGMTINAGLIEWPAPVHGQTVSVRAADGRGGFDVQTFTISVIAAAPLSITGTVFRDANQNALYDGGEPGLEARIVYVDRNGNRRRDADEAFDATDAAGQYVLAGLLAGSHVLRVEPVAGWFETTLVEPPPATVLVDQNLTGPSFGLIERLVPNGAPYFTSPASIAATAADPLDHTVVARDPDQDPLTYSLAYGPAGLAVERLSGRLVWTPAATVTGVVYAGVRADDGRGGTSLQQLTITVANSNDAPVFVSEPVRVARIPGVYSYDADAQDPLRPTEPMARYWLDPSAAPAGMTINEASGLIEWTVPVLGLYDVVVWAADQDGQTAWQHYRLHVTDQPANQPPVLDTLVEMTIPVGAAFADRVDAVDPDGDPLTFELLNPSAIAGLTMPASPGNWLSWTPTVAQITAPAAPHEFSVRVSDGPGGHTVDRSYRIHVVAAPPANGAPAITSTPVKHGVAGELYIYQAAATDPEGHTVRWQLLEGPAGMTIGPDTGLVVWAAGESDLGTHAVRIKAIDAYGASAVQPYTIDVTLNRPPYFTTPARTWATVGKAYAYHAGAADPDGQRVTFSAASATGLAIDPDTGLARWIPEEAGSYFITLMATDPWGLSASQGYWINVQPTPPNQPPVIRNVPRNVALVGREYAWLVDAVDPDHTLTQLTFSVTPTGIDGDLHFDPAVPNRLVWNPTAALAGQQVSLSVTVTDPLGATAKRTWPVTVRQNNFPLVTVSDQTITAGQTFAYGVSATDADTLRYALVAPPDRMTIDEVLGLIEWPGAPAGDYTVALTVSDGFDTVPASFVLHVLPDTTPPQVELRTSQRVVDSGQQVWIWVTATDDVAVTGRTLTIDGQAVALNPDGSLLYTVTGAPGQTFNLSATASDAAGNVSEPPATGTLLVRNPADQPPVVAISSPAAGARITELAQLLGTVSDPENMLVSYTVTLQPLDGSGQERVHEFTAAPGPYLPSTTGGEIDTIDATSLPNGAYLVTVAATDYYASVTTAEVKVEIEGQLKLGSFTLTFTDLELPAPGLPITVTRSYDTLRADEQGDFGYGWRMDLLSVRVDVVQPGRDTDEPEPLRRGDRLVFTLPDGSKQGFTFWPRRVNPDFYHDDNQYWPAFEPDLGSNSTLRMTGRHPALLGMTNGFDDVDMMALYNPASGAYGDYDLTLRSGTKLAIDPQTGTLREITDRTGNTLAFTPGGILHSAGRSITFDRDAAGRITSIVLPDDTPANPADNPRIVYTYSPAGDLVSVTDRAGATTTFTYLSDPAHYLEKIFDPLGREAVRSEFYDDGRLKKVTDADGQTVEYDYTLNPSEVPQGYLAAGRAQKVTDQLGCSTIQIADGRGNVVYQRDPEGGIRLRTYNDKDRMLSETIVVGQIDSPANGETDDLTTSSTYDPTTGDKLTATDARGNVTTYTYNGYGQITSTSSPTGTTTTGYDARGLPTCIEDAIGKVNRFEFDDKGNLKRVFNDANVLLVDNAHNQYGDLTSLTPAAGHVTYFDYNLDGNQVATWFFDSDDQVLQVTHYNDAGRVTGSRHLVLPAGQHLTSNLADVNFSDQQYAPYTRWATGVVYNLAGQVIRSTDQQGNASETTYGVRGQQIQIRTQAESASGAPAWLLSRAYHDPKGRAVVAADSFVEGAAVTSANALAFNEATQTYSTFTFDNTADTTATFSIYDGADRVVETWQLKDVIVAVVGAEPNYATEIRVGGDAFVPPATAATGEELYETYFREIGEFFQTHGVVVSTSRMEYDNAGRVTLTVDSFGAESRTTYNRNGEVIQRATQSRDANGQLVWLVSRTIYDLFGRAELSADRFVVTASSPNEVTGVATPATRTIYDAQGRAVASVRLADVIVDLQGIAGGSYSSVLISAGTEVYRSETAYDERTGRMKATVAAHSPGEDGPSTDYLYDHLGRQVATVGPAIPVRSVDLRGVTLPSGTTHVRHRNETHYDDTTGRVAETWANLLVAVDAAGNVLATIDANRQVAIYEYDAEGRTTKTTQNGYRDDGGGNAVLMLSISTQSRYDQLGRVAAESGLYDELALNVTWSEVEHSFTDGTNVVPTKRYEYDSEGQLTAVVLPAVTDPRNGQSVNPRYEYAYNSQGKQTLIRDPLGRETRFTYDSQGRQLDRTLPLGLGVDGIQGTADDTTLPEGDFREQFQYDNRGRQVLHVSFEGKYEKTVYDDQTGRLQERRFYNDLAAYNAGTVAETWTYKYDAFGREVEVRQEAGTAVRTTTTSYDEQDRVKSIASPEGTVNYRYDALGRKTRMFTGSEADPTKDVSYSYDALSRLTAVEVHERNNVVPPTPERTSYFYDSWAISTTSASPAAWWTTSSMTPSIAWTRSLRSRTWATTTPIPRAWIGSWPNTTIRSGPTAGELASLNVSGGTTTPTKSWTPTRTG